MNELNSYLSGLNALANRRDGASLAKQLALPLGANATSSKDFMQMRQFADKIRSIDVNSMQNMCGKKISDPNIGAVVAHRTAALTFLVYGDLQSGRRWMVDRR
jgi:hypothetical protein